MKRLFDVVASFFGLVVFSPLFVIISLLIVLDSRGGVFFIGPRVGYKGKKFHIIKFRSMVPDCEGKGKWNIGDNDVRITKFGHFLRRTKIDELPQLINVLIGDMSFVGPRPELQYYVDMYSKEEKAILDSRPGITDWASMVNIEQFKEFSKSIDPDDYYLNFVRPLKLKLQLYYRYNHSFLSDMKCIVWTVYKIIFHSNRLPREIQTIVNQYNEGLKEKNDK